MCKDGYNLTQKTCRRCKDGYKPTHERYRGSKDEKQIQGTQGRIKTKTEQIRMCKDGYNLTH